MQYYKNILTIEANWLINQGIMKKSNYDKLRRKGDIQVIRRGCRGREALVAYESLPERFKIQVDNKVDVYKSAKRNMIEECIEHDVSISNFFDNYIIRDERYLPAEKRREYYTNAIILNAIHRLINARKVKHSALGHGATRFWDEISILVQDLNSTKYPHTLPVNPRSLERKYKGYLAFGCDSLIHRNFIIENRNAAKIADEKQESAMAVLISDPRNLENEQVARIYNALATKMDWKEITAKTVAVWRDKLDDIIYARRYGAVAYRNNKGMQIKRSAPTAPLLFWTIDGWDAELLFQKHEGSRTTYHNRPTIIVVLDPCCKYPIGYAIGDHETPQLIKAALRDAARHTAQLFGQMYRVNQLQSDNYAIKTMMPLYIQMADKVTPAAVKNAKAKIIEPWFDYFNKKYCQLTKNWSGLGITSRKEKQPNSEYLNRERHRFPDFKGVCQQLISFIAAERAELHDQYVSMFDKLPEKRRLPLSMEQYLMMYGETTGHRNLLRGSGLRITIGGVIREYDCFKQSFREHASVRWEVRYDPEDLSRVLAVDDKETLRFVLEEKYVQPMALADRKEGDAEALQRVLEYNRLHEEDITDKMCKYQNTVRNIFNETKDLGTLQKLMLCDSGGQHKDRKNDVRLHTEKEDIFEVSLEDVLDEI